jgi:hypothetical protein
MSEHGRVKAAFVRSIASIASAKLCRSGFTYRQM